MTPDQFAFLSATELVARMKAGDLSAVELTDATLARIEERNPSLTAVVHLYPDEARDRAKQADQAIANGRDLGPLHGLPTLIKDGFGQKAGWISTYGGIGRLASLRDTESCPFTERVEAAGGVVLGKTNAPAMGFRGTCDNYLFGPTRNPFDLQRNSGGSSGGSAAAVADGLVAVAEGTDGGGSIRIPASWCGLVGFKPSWGRVPIRRRPDVFNIATFTTEGPIARTVADAALIYDVISGPDARDPFCLDVGPAAVAGLRAGVRGSRIAYSPDFGVYPVDPEVAEIVRRAAYAFAECGGHVEQVSISLPYDQRQLSDMWCRMLAMLSLDTMSVLRDRGVDVLTEARESLPDEFLGWISVAQQLTRADLKADSQMRTVVFDAVQDVFSSYDLLLTPTLGCLPVRNTQDGNTLGPAQVAGVQVDPLIGWCLTYLLNLSGHPAITVPAGQSEAGLPVGLQIIGERLADQRVFAAAAAFEEARPWQETYQRCAMRSLAVLQP
jgi:amidase